MRRRSVSTCRGLVKTDASMKRLPIYAFSSAYLSSPTSNNRELKSCDSYIRRRDELPIKGEFKMKNRSFIILCALTFSMPSPGFAWAGDKELNVIAREYSVTLQCRTQLVEDGYRDIKDHTTMKTFCTGLEESLENWKKDFLVILKVEGQNRLADTLLNKISMIGDWTQSPEAKVRLVGILR